MIERTLLAQRDFGDWDWLYLVAVVLLPLLGQIGRSLRKRFGGKEEEGLEEETEGRIVLLPPEPRSSAPPRARPLTPADKPTPPGPARAAGPVAPPPLRAPQPQRTVFPPTARPAATPPAPQQPLRAKARERPAEVARPARRKVKLPAPTVPAVDVHADADRVQWVSTEREAAWHVRLGRLDVAELRRAVVLSEILRPPLALRRPGEEPWNAV